MGTYTNYLRLSLLLLRMGRRGGGLPPPPACPVCQRSVFPMEALMASDRTPYHKVCLKCCECARKLDVMSLNEHEKLLYCCVCYQALFQAQVNEIEGGKGWSKNKVIYPYKEQVNPR